MFVLHPVDEKHYFHESSEVFLLTFLSCQSAGVLQACPATVKGLVWPLHPIRLRLISLFFRVKDRDEERHWALCNPPRPPHSPSPPPCYPSTCCGFVCGFGRALAFSKKANTDHTTSTRRAHTQAGTKFGKMRYRRVRFLSGWKCHRNRILTMKGH